MISNEEILKKIINGISVGDFYPYMDGTKQQIEYYIKSIVSDLERSKLIKVEADFNSYGSGYSSYIDVFCYKRDGSSTVNKDGTLWIDGITIYISKLAPVAIFGANDKTKHSRGGCYGFLDINSIGTVPDGNWNEILYVISEKINKYGIEILHKKELAQLLNFKMKIPTIMNEGAYKVFDAIFYWED